MRANTCDELRRAERLGHIVVSPEVEQPDFFCIGMACRENDDRRLGPLPHLAAHFISLNVGKSEVENHCVRTLRGCKCEGLVTCRGFEDPRIIRLERITQCASDLLLVIYDE